MEDNSLFLRRNFIFICSLFVIIIWYVFSRIDIAEDDSFIHTYNQFFNERQFLVQYLFLFMFSLFPVLKELYMIEKIYRAKNKKKYIKGYYVSVIKRAVLYSGVINAGWFFIIATKTTQWNTSYEIIYMAKTFLVQCIGWTFIGNIILSIYIFIKNVVFTFIVSEILMIAFNLSLYVMSNSETCPYIRQYDFMFGYCIQNSILETIIIGVLNIILSFALFIIGYKKILNSDFLIGGKADAK